jgi:hypothetical protein
VYLKKYRDHRAARIFQPRECFCRKTAAHCAVAARTLKGLGLLPKTTIHQMGNFALAAVSSAPDFDS